MVGRKRKAAQRSTVAAQSTSTMSVPRTTRATRSAATTANRAAGVPDVYREMLVAAEVAPSSPERPLKKRKPPGARRLEPAQVDDVVEPEPTPATERKGNVGAGQTAIQSKSNGQNGTAGHSSLDNHNSDSDDSDNEIEFEDVALPDPTIQTMERDSDEEEEEEDEEEEQIQLEDVDLTLINSFGLGDAPAKAEEPRVLELDLAAAQSRQRRQAAERRKPINKEEKDRRIVVHKTHLLCLLAHVSRRNQWCNDGTVQKNLRLLLSGKTVKYLNPSPELTQFGQTNSLKQGLEDVMTKFKTRFKITERGMRRALWAEKQEHLDNVSLHGDEHYNLACANDVQVSTPRRP